MLVFIIRRIILLIPVLLGVTLVTFALTRIIPGDPIDKMVSPMASKATRERVAEQAGLNDPLALQYVNYIRDLLHGDLGDSFTTSHPVRDDLSSRFGPTLELTLFAMILAIVASIPLGIAAAVWRDRWVDHVSRLIAVVGVAMPVFWLALLAIYFLFYRWHWLP